MYLRLDVPEDLPGGGDVPCVAPHRTACAYANVSQNRLPNSGIISTRGEDLIGLLEKQVCPLGRGGRSACLASLDRNKFLIIAIHRAQSNLF